MDIFGSSGIPWKVFWPFFAMVGFLVIIKIVFEIVLPDLIKIYRNKKKYNEGSKWRSDRELLQWIKGLAPTEFEEYIAKLFKDLGFNATAVGRSHDGGIDVEIEKDGLKSYIQCKRYTKKSVSVREVREFYGALADFLAEGKAYFVTTSVFTLESEKYAEGKPMELIDGQKLIKYVHLAAKALSEKEVVVSGQKCPDCGNDLVIPKAHPSEFAQS
jgi:HJR/Mrr/RecB family endonuclease